MLSIVLIAKSDGGRTITPKSASSSAASTSNVAASSLAMLSASRATRYARGSGCSIARVRCRRNPRKSSAGEELVEFVETRRKISCFVPISGVEQHSAGTRPRGATLLEPELELFHPHAHPLDDLVIAVFEMRPATPVLRLARVAHTARRAAVEPDDDDLEASAIELGDRFRHVGGEDAAVPSVVRLVVQLTSLPPSIHAGEGHLRTWQLLDAVTVAAQAIDHTRHHTGRASELLDLRVLVDET